eukprot:CAMPEP_0118934844 /NCGR_PEP_ID=MMETSP1169-20130426/14276_1 /TAXON_ID=36882 /ORGANISM="Pyramimonas obovata, Strain CCMP722" /LENGTH=337 /DNA_ID=CAMNT_0006877787 /DNA_START=81 /DNA_END=1094 /DNA_ORIENTATION=+
MGVSAGMKFTAAATLTCLTCSQGLLMEASKEHGKYPYNVATVPLMSELMKLILSSFLLYQQYTKDPKATQMTLDWRSIMLFPIPSIIYLFHNNVQFYTMAYVDAATYQILGNLKIVTTGFLFWIALKRYLSRIQWLALLLLMAGATTSQISGCEGSVLAAPAMGYFLGILSAFLSATAGVYTEFLMKKNNDSLYFQNVQLYGFGTLFNAIRLSFDDATAGYENGSWLYSGFHGWNWVTWAIAVNFAFSGLFVSWIMKYADTIVKVYATSSAMLLTALLSVWFFDLAPTLQLFLGILIACVSINLYFMPKDSTPPKSASLPVAVKAEAEPSPEVDRSR